MIVFSQRESACQLHGNERTFLMQYDSSERCQEPTFRGTISNTENRGVPRCRGVGRVCGPRFSRMLAGRHCIVCKTICRLSMHPQLEDMSVPKEILRSSECGHISVRCRDPRPRERASDD